MGTVGRAELRDEGLHALLDRVLRQHHGARDLLVCIPLREVTEKLELPRREGLAGRRGGARLALFLRCRRLLGLFRQGDWLTGAAERMGPRATYRGHPLDSPP